MDMDSKGGPARGGLSIMDLYMTMELSGERIDVTFNDSGPAPAPAILAKADSRYFVG
jgi:hypothetical protein